MMKRFRVLLLLLPLSAFAAPRSSQDAQAQLSLPSTFAEKIHLPGISNAGKLNEHLYRGAQPQRSAFAELQKRGVTTVVSLRRENPAAIAAEKNQVESLGMRFVHIPVGGFSAPTDEQIIRFLSIFRDHQEDTVFVHCHYGEDRTGVFIASYRMGVEHWPADQALQEMYRFGFHRHSQPQMRAYARNFPALLNSAPELTQFENTLSVPALSRNPVPSNSKLPPQY
jgi:protein tyrosine/serine phosphatase